MLLSVSGFKRGRARGPGMIQIILLGSLIQFTSLLCDSLSRDTNCSHLAAAQCTPKKNMPCLCIVGLYVLKKHLSLSHSWVETLVSKHSPIVYSSGVLILSHLRDVFSLSSSSVSPSVNV